MSSAAAVIGALRVNINVSNIGSSLIDGWMACDLTSFLIVFVISGQWKVDNERLCARELRLRLRRFCLERRSNAAV